MEISAERGRGPPAFTLRDHDQEPNETETEAEIEHDTRAYFRQGKVDMRGCTCPRRDGWLEDAHHHMRLPLAIQTLDHRVGSRAGEAAHGDGVAAPLRRPVAREHLRNAVYLHRLRSCASPRLSRLPALGPTHLSPPHPPHMDAALSPPHPISPSSLFTQRPPDESTHEKGV